MYKSVAIVNDNPLRIAVAVIVIRFDAGIFQEIFADAVGNGRHLHGTRPLAYYEVGCRSRFYFGKVDNSYATPFTFLDSFNYKLCDVSFWLVGHFVMLVDYNAKLMKIQ